MPITKYPRVGDIPELITPEDPSLLLPEEEPTFEETLQELRGQRDIGALEPRSQEQLLETFRTTRAPQTIQKPQTNLTFEEGSEITKPESSQVAVPQNARTEINEGLSDAEELSRAQNMEGFGKLASMFGGAFAKIGTGYAGGKLGVKAPEYDEKSIQAAGELGKIPLANLLQRREEEAKKASREKLKLEYQNVKDANDPTSELSKSYSDTAQQYIDMVPELKAQGIVVRGKSKAEIESLLALHKAQIDLLQKQKDQDRKELQDKLNRESAERIADKKAERELEREKKKDDKDSSPTPTQTKDIEPFINGLRAMHDLKTLLKEASPTGTAKDLKLKLQKLMHSANPKDVELYSKLGFAFAQFRHALSGTASSDKEGGQLASYKPQITDDPESILAQIKASEDYYTTRTRTKVDAIIGSGKNPSKLLERVSDVYSPSTDKTEEPTKPPTTPIKLTQKEIDLGYRARQNSKVIQILDSKGNVVREMPRE